MSQDVPTVDGRAIVTIEEAAKMTRASVRTVQDWITKGKVEIVRGAGGRRWVYVDTLWRKAGDKA